MDKVLDRLKVLMDSSTPIVVMETVEETRAVRMARAAGSALNLAAFEWTIASGVARCGVSTVATIEQGAFPAGGYRAGEVKHFAESAKALYERRNPGKMPLELHGINSDAVFSL